MLVKDKHTQCYDEIIKNGSLKSYFFCSYREMGENDSQFRFAYSGFGIPLR